MGTPFFLRHRGYGNTRTPEVKRTTDELIESIPMGKNS
jgi:hypothetical protein